jgi:tetratricopeptide (TPR) repeat protein
MAAPEFESIRPAWRPQWILGGWRDLLLIIGTPLLILPLASLAQLRLSVMEIGLYVAAFGALGHHLPGMMRAYGDRELFARFRLRFILAPIFLVTVCVYFTLYNAAPLALMVTLWGTWHGLAQVYGFARIYDAKLARPSWLTTRLDLWLCLAWFGAGVLYSPARLVELLVPFFDAGGPLLVSELVGGFRLLWIYATVAVTIAFAVNALREWRAGRPCSPAKLLLFASSFSFWWFSMVAIGNPILGVAIFEVFHDVQYLAIVWGYNRKRVETGHDLAGFMRLLFRRSGVLVGVYVGLVFAYGSSQLFVGNIQQEVVRSVLMGVLAASGLLHFYFDAFIWSVRDAQTRESLGLDSETGVAAVRASLANLGPQAAKWALFVVPLLWLGLATPAEMASPVDRLSAVVKAAPASSQARFKLAQALDGEGRHREAIGALKQAVALQPGFAEAHANLGTIYMRRKQPSAAEASLREALRLEPSMASARIGLGRLLLEREDMDAAALEFELALESDPSLAKAEYFLGVTHLAGDRLDEAARHFERGLELGEAELIGARGATLMFQRLAAAYSEAGRAEEGARWREIAARPVSADASDY